MSGTPFGNFESAEGRVDGVAVVTGWTIDPDDMTVSTRVHAYIDGPAGGTARGVDLGLASKRRLDVAEAYPGAGPLHGFNKKITDLSAGTHTLYLYAINAAGGGDNPLLRTITITVRR